MDVLSRFINYARIDTASKDDMDCIPSTGKQFNLGKLLVEELQALGVPNARIDEHGYVYAHIDANKEGVPAYGFIAHMDTSPDASGKNVEPRIVKCYDGGDIKLNDSTTISPAEFPSIKRYIGQDIVVANGTTLLGADDKAGVAEIMTLVQTLMNDPTIKHGKICIAFTPDEEVGRGSDMFDVKGFGADYAYTVDGGELGEIEYENFNAASANIVVHGRGIHPGSAKDKMINSIHVANEFDAMLPSAQRPEYTENYEGFIHLTDINGDIESTHMHYIIRDHDFTKFTEKKRVMQAAADYINLRYGSGTLELAITDSYYNMKEKITPHMHLIDNVCRVMRELGVEPIINPVRGGTDGARLSYMGLPCPNICTGGHNFHGRYEYIPVQSMEKVCDILLSIVKLVAEQ